ncbi:MAG: hypothetical protein FWH03_02990 [Firmicutes bacterium]|nr:hypothetical protein [Bacillota bacterium]
MDTESGAQKIRNAIVDCLGRDEALSCIYAAQVERFFSKSKRKPNSTLFADIALRDAQQNCRVYRIEIKEHTVM